jgi:hypothetical protein
VFNIELDLPSGKRVRIPELDNKSHLAIIKFCENKDYSGLNKLFERLYLTPDLNIFDRFYILMYVRRLFVGSDITFIGKDDMEISYSISDMLVRLEDNYIDVHKELVYGDIALKVGIPVGSYFDSLDDLYNFTIKSVRFKDTEVDFTQLSNEDKRLLLNRLPSSVFLLLQSYITELSNTLFDLTLIEENKAFDIAEVKVNILGNGVIHFISSLFAYDLFSFYETLYYYNNLVSGGSGDFFDLTFNEVQLLLKIHEERIKRENDEINKSNNS